MKLRHLPAVLALSLTATLAHAISPGDLYLQGGTQGIGIGYAQPLNQWIGVRADINGFGLSHNFSAGDLDYDGHLHLFGVGTYVDLFPIPSTGFRISTGLIFNSDYLKGTARPNSSGNITLNGNTYYVPNGSVSAKAKEPTVMPYLGIGYGHQQTVKRGLGFTADIGVAFGRPSVDFNVSPDVVAAAGQDNVAAEEAQLRQKVSKYHVFPVAQLGITYRW
jgi:hypothetical protein